MSENTDSVVNQGEFHGRVKPSKPMMKHGHQIGRMETEADRRPEFHAEVLPPGSAPADSSYRPNPRPEDMGGMYANAEQSLPGTDSGAMHTGLGHPGQGQSSAELRHDGHSHNKRAGQGTLGRGNTVGQSQKEINPQDPQFANQRALDKDYPTGQHLYEGGRHADMDARQ